MVTSPASPPHRPSAGKWPFIIVGLLLTHVVLMLWAVSITLNNPSFSVVPDYYNRAVAWDADKAAKLASDKLGWKLAVEPAGIIDAHGQRGVSFVITDKAGKPLEDAIVEVHFFHHAHGDQSQHLAPTSTGAGRYTAQAFMPYVGFYEYHVTVTAGADKFVATVTQWLSNYTAPAASTARFDKQGPA